MKNSNKKGFTIVELVIVIAVIAILAAVLIPTFSNITEKSRVASDMTMIGNINTGLQADEALHGKPGTMHEALEIALNTGYKLENIEPISESEVIYDSKNNRFALIDKNGKLVFGEDTTKAITDTENSADKHLLWKIAKADADVDTILNAGYSVYLASNDIVGANVTLTGLGFDVGDNANKFTVTYSGAGYETVIRTNIASTLTIDAANDTVKHYGAVDTLTITAIASNSYHEFGFVKTVGNMGSGRFVAEGTAKFHQKKDEISFGSMTFEEKSGVIYGEHLSVINGKYTCCGVDANEHDHAWELDSENSSPAKCVETGVNVYKCTVDGCEANKVETLPALGHTWNEGVITTQPTETKEGVKTFTCTRCSETKTEGVPTLDHVHAKGEYVAEVPATCENPGTKGYYPCTGCSLKFEDAELKIEITDLTIPALGHDMPNDWTIKEATCTTSGEKTKACSRCDHKETETIPATGHNWDAGVVTKAATCAAEGTKTFTCSKCSDTKTEAMAKTNDHNYGAWKALDNGTEHIRTCSACSASETAKHNMVNDKCNDCGYTVTPTLSDEQKLIDKLNAVSVKCTETSIMKTLAYLAENSVSVNVADLVHKDSSKTFAYDITTHKFYIVNIANGAVEYPAGVTAQTSNLVYVVNDTSKINSNMVRIYLNNVETIKRSDFVVDTSVGASKTTSKDSVANQEFKAAFVSVEVGAGVKTIDIETVHSVKKHNGCLYGCTTLESVYIGNSVETITCASFADTSNLKYVYYNANATSIDNDNPNSEINPFSKAGSTSGAVELEIGKNVISVPRLFDLRYTSNVYVNKVTFEEGTVCQTIEERAFYGFKITEIILPKTLKYIEGYASSSAAFLDCANIEKIYWYGNAISISTSEYYSTTLKKWVEEKTTFVYGGTQNNGLAEFQEHMRKAGTHSMSPNLEIIYLDK